MAFIVALHLVLSLFVLSVYGYAYEGVFNSSAVDTTACSYSATCTVSGIEGVCVSVSAGCCTGTTTSNLCPGSSDIKCCTNNKCSTPSGSGTCKQTSACSGTSIPGYCTGPSDLQCCVENASKISRDEVIARMQDWVNRKIPYSQTATTDGYRQDCSGYVSMGWKSSTAGGGHTTYNMQEICHKIDKSQLMKGDAILNPDSHVLMFDYWVDSDAFMEYAEHSSGTVASHDKTSYSYYASNGFFPCRYNLIA